MFPITNTTVIGAVRSAMLLVWTAAVTWLLDLAIVQSFGGLEDFVNDLTPLVTGGLVVLLSGLVWSAITWLAGKKGSGGFWGYLGAAASYAFVIPTQPTYVPPNGGSPGGLGSGLA